VVNTAHPLFVRMKKLNKKSRYRIAEKISGRIYDISVDSLNVLKRFKRANKIQDKNHKRFPLCTLCIKIFFNKIFPDKVSFVTDHIKAGSFRQHYINQKSRIATEKLKDFQPPHLASSNMRPT
jgi:hypothetical protein